MPRDLPLGNGRLLLNFDKNYNVRDIYWPHVGQELHTAGDISHTGVWVEGRFAWFDSPDWQREMIYEAETLVTYVTLSHPALQLHMVVRDCVDFNRPLFLRQVSITNLADHPREVRLFFHYDWHIWDAADANTVFYDPARKALVAYKQQAYFLMNGQIGEGPNAQIGISSWATGKKETGGSEGTWRDAEDGELGRNPIAQGSVDGTIALHARGVGAGEQVTFHHWLAIAETYGEVHALDDLVRERGPSTFISRTLDYWRLWINKEPIDTADLDDRLLEQYKASLLIIRTQIDNTGAILGANDTD